MNKFKIFLCFVCAISFVFIIIWISSSKDGRMDVILKEIHQINKLLTQSSQNIVSRRLEEANENWERGLQARKILESKDAVDHLNGWNQKNGYSIWDFFYPNFDCPHTVERIGRTGDGGKWICGLRHLKKKLEPCIVYSFGGGGDTSFEEEIVSRSNCSVYMFDHTIDTSKVELPKLHPERVWIEKVGLGTRDFGNLRTLLSTMKTYGHDFIDILKIDVEGAEFAIFENLKNDFSGTLPIGQLSIELHLVKPMTKANFERYKSSIIDLENMGLRAFKNEFNFLSMVITRHPMLCEYSFINVKHSNNFLLHE